jgi:hypothetical protein
MALHLLELTHAHPEYFSPLDSAGPLQHGGVSFQTSGTALVSGTLQKKSAGVGARWQRRHFVLFEREFTSASTANVWLSHCLAYYSKAPRSGCCGTPRPGTAGRRPQMVLGLRQKDVVLESDGGAGLTFQLTLPDYVLCLQAEDPPRLGVWLEALRVCTRPAVELAGPA